MGAEAVGGKGRELPCQRAVLLQPASKVVQHSCSCCLQDRGVRQLMQQRPCSVCNADSLQAAGCAKKPSLKLCCCASPPLFKPHIQAMRAACMLCLLPQPIIWLLSGD